jgi:Glyoxalase-like domain
MPVTETKVVKNRVHVDLTSGPEDRNAEIERILALGARSVDVGHTGDESWRCWPIPKETSSASCGRSRP